MANEAVDKKMTNTHDMHFIADQEYRQWLLDIGVKLVGPNGDAHAARVTDEQYAMIKAKDRAYRNSPEYIEARRARLLEEAQALIEEANDLGRS